MNCFRSLAMAILSLLFIVLGTGCESGVDSDHAPGTIGGTISGLKPGSDVVLRSFSNGNLVNVGSAKLDSTGSFELTPESPLSRGYHQLLFARQYPVVLITDSTEGITVNGQAQVGSNYLLGATILGSNQSEIIQEFYNVIMPLQQRMKDLERDGRSVDAAKRAAAKEAMETKADSITSVSLAFAEAHQNELAALCALESLDATEHKELFKSTLGALKANHGETFYYKKIKGNYERANRPRNVNLANPTTKKSSAKNSKYGQGDEAPDIVMNDPDGNTRKLSDLRGKVVLLDFWASWCGPCRRENPSVVRAYEKYKNQGFEVFSVSLDSDASRWKKAIEQDQLSWPSHVSDLAGWRNAAAREYGISSIPHTMLIDRDGLILATHLRGSGVESALRGVFGE